MPPRDFRVATYKFAGVSEGLPHDEGLEQIVRGGLNGTAMLPWMVRDEPLSAIIQYIKTFSPEGEGWRDPDTPKGNVVKVSEDPWKGKEEVARAAGEALYHGKVSCYSCHPSYVTREEINAHLVAKGSARQTKFRDNLWAPEVKPSQSYSRPVAGDPECSDAQPCEDKDQVCRYGRCEQQIPILPPDFTFNRLRTGNTPARLALLIKSGIPGTAMPAWESIPDKDIWAIAHYVNSLTALKDTPKASALRQRLKADTAPLAQPEPEPAAPAPTPAIPTEAAESVEVPPTP